MAATPANTADCSHPPAAPDIVTEAGVAKAATVEIVKLAVSEPAFTDTVAGTCTLAFPLLSTTDVAVVDVALSVTVPVVVPMPKMTGFAIVSDFSTLTAEAGRDIASRSRGNRSRRTACRRNCPPFRERFAAIGGDKSNRGVPITFSFP